MKHLRHPIRAIREPFGTAGLIVACLALVLAMGGAAVAAKGGLTKSQEKQVKKIAQAEAKKYAKAGPAGPAGPTGATGPAGARGDTGAAGPEGKQGPQGIQGPQGSQGQTGAKGSPWTAGGTLPAGATETGAWTLGPAPAGTVTFGTYATLSFPIPLEAQLALSQVHFINLSGKEMPGEVTQTACPGTVDEPAAEPENLCVYQGQLFDARFGRIDKLGAVEEKGASTAGAKLVVELEEEESSAWGTFAVAGPES